MAKNNSIAFQPADEELVQAQAAGLEALAAKVAALEAENKALRQGDKPVANWRETEVNGQRVRINHAVIIPEIGLKTVENLLVEPNLVAMLLQSGSTAVEVVE